jgi:hypothetical protein
MSVAAEEAIGAWVNNRTDLVGRDRPLSRGASLLQQRSPADGAHALIDRQGGPAETLVAGQSPFDLARIIAVIRAGTPEAVELAAKAYADAVRSLTGCPVPCGETGVFALTHDNLTGPQFVQQPADSGEQYSFQVDFLLRGAS